MRILPEMPRHDIIGYDKETDMWVFTALSRTISRSSLFCAQEALARLFTVYGQPVYCSGMLSHPATALYAGRDNHGLDQFWVRKDGTDYYNCYFVGALTRRDAYVTHRDRIETTRSAIELLQRDLQEYEDECRPFITQAPNSVL